MEILKVFFSENHQPTQTITEQTDASGYLTPSEIQGGGADVTANPIYESIDGYQRDSGNQFEEEFAVVDDDIPPSLPPRPEHLQHSPELETSQESTLTDDAKEQTDDSQFSSESTGASLPIGGINKEEDQSQNYSNPITKKEKRKKMCGETPLKMKDGEAPLKMKINLGR